MKIKIFNCFGLLIYGQWTILLIMRIDPGGGGGGTLIFSPYVGSGPASTIHQKKKYQEFQALQKNI